MSNPTSKISTHQTCDKIIQLISPWVAVLGYQIIHLEIHSHKQKVLRIFIDHLEGSSGKGIGIEDCVKVSRGLDEKLEQLPEIQAALPENFELEVSSPGIDRPLRTEHDFERFVGKEVRIHVYRPLTLDELENELHLQKNPKQKNFLGTLLGLEKNKVVLDLGATLGSSKASHKKKKGKMSEGVAPNTNSVEGVLSRIMIPLPLISKANLEPKFEFEESNERES